MALMSRMEGESLAFLAQVHLEGSVGVVEMGQNPDRKSVSHVGTGHRFPARIHEVHRRAARSNPFLDQAMAEPRANESCDAVTNHYAERQASATGDIEVRITPTIMAWRRLGEERHRSSVAKSAAHGKNSDLKGFSRTPELTTSFLIVLLSLSKFSVPLLPNTLSCCQ